MEISTMSIEDLCDLDYLSLSTKDKQSYVQRLDKIAKEEFRNATIKGKVELLWLRLRHQPYRYLPYTVMGLGLVGLACSASRERQAHKQTKRSHAEELNQRDWQEARMMTDLVNEHQRADELADENQRLNKLIHE